MIPPHLFLSDEPRDEIGHRGFKLGDAMAHLQRIALIKAAAQWQRFSWAAVARQLCEEYDVQKNWASPATQGCRDKLPRRRFV
jgi:hypothetical protein